MKYIQYTEEDFVKDAHFQKWIFAPDDSTRFFWGNWILEHPEKKKTVENAACLLRLIHSEPAEELLATEIDALWQNIILQRKEETHHGRVLHDSSFQFMINRLLRYAALFVGLLGTAFTLYYLTFTSEEIGPKSTGSQITLQLEDGRLQVLDERAFETIIDAHGAKVVRQERNTLVYDKKETRDAEGIAYNELLVPYGKKFELILSDGSHIFLNSGSKLRYPVAFPKGGPRNVFLNGEAYFSVEKDEIRPFTVITDKMNTRVYGTKFNVSSYTDENNTATVLIEGSVGVYIPQDGVDQEAIAIVPGQRAVANKDKIAVDRVNVNKYIAWTEGKLLFVDDRFEVIIKELARHFNVTIDNQVSRLNQKRFTGTFTTEPIDQILRVFQEHTPFDFRVKGSSITISEKTTIKTENIMN